MDLGDLFDKGGPVVDALSKKVGVKPEQAKDALSKIAPFVQEKLGKKKGTADKAAAGNLKGYAEDPSKLGDPDADRHGQDLLDDVDADERERHVQEVARSTGLAPDVVRKMMPAATTATVGAMDKAGALRVLQDNFEELDRKIKEIKLDASDGKMDGKVHGVPIKK